MADKSDSPIPSSGDEHSLDGFSAMDRDQEEHTFEKELKKLEVPECLILLLRECGFETLDSVSSFNESKLNECVEYLQSLHAVITADPDSCKAFEPILGFYMKNPKCFRLKPGHRTILLDLPKKLSSHSFGSLPAKVPVPVKKTPQPKRRSSTMSHPVEVAAAHSVVNLDEEPSDDSTATEGKDKNRLCPGIDSARKALLNDLKKLHIAFFKDLAYLDSTEISVSVDDESPSGLCASIRCKIGKCGLEEHLSSSKIALMCYVGTGGELSKIKLYAFKRHIVRFHGERGDENASAPMKPQNVKPKTISVADMFKTNTLKSTHEATPGTSGQAARKQQRSLERSIDCDSTDSDVEPPVKRKGAVVVSSSVSSDEDESVELQPFP